MKTIRTMMIASSLLAPICAQDATVSVVHAVPGLSGPVEVFANGANLFSFDYGEPWLLVATGADANTMAMVNFGTSITALNGFALPLDLTAQGAPGCFLNTDSFAALAVLTDATGRVEVPYLVPTSLFGLLQPGYFQVGTYSSSNALGVVTTEYLEIR